MEYILAIAEGLNVDPVGGVNVVGAGIEIYMLFQLIGYVKDLVRSLNAYHIEINKALYEVNRNCTKQQ